MSKTMGYQHFSNSHFNFNTKNNPTLRPTHNKQQLQIQSIQSMILKPTSHSLSMITPVKSDVVTKSLPSCVNDASHLPSRETTIFCSGPRRTPSPSLCTPSSSTASTTASSTPSKTSTFPETVYCGSITAIQ